LLKVQPIVAVCGHENFDNWRIRRFDRLCANSMHSTYDGLVAHIVLNERAVAEKLACKPKDESSRRHARQRPEKVEQE
jgi:hypothetical protein